MSSKDKNFKMDVLPAKVIFFLCLVTTLYFNTQFYDAFNSAKLLVLILGSSWMLGYLIRYQVQDFASSIKTTENILFKVLILSFILSLCLSSLFAYNKNVAVLGESFRRNGLLTYLALLVFFLVSKKFIRVPNIYASLNIVNFTIFLVVTYAFIQIYGKDPVNWSSKQVFSTLGNTNFSGAVMSILAILIFGQICIREIRILRRIFLILLFLFTLFAIYRTNARQALIQLTIGLLCFSIYFAWRKKRIYGLILSFISLVLIIFGLLGALNSGPFKGFIYKDSVSVRGFYWRAGIRMFKENPWFGVGLDNYNYFFKQYRDVDYSLRYGFDLTSSNAHNVFIQNFATGGFFVGTSYILLQIYIFFRAIKLLSFSFSSRDSLIKVSIVISWIAYQVQSLVSIDNIGISIWGSVLGGSIVGMSSIDRQSPQIHKSEKGFATKSDGSRLLLSAICFFCSLLIVIPMYRVDHSVWLSVATKNPGDKEKELIFKLNSESVLNSNFAPTDYKNVIFSSMFENQDLKLVNEKIKVQYNKDPRNLDTLSLLIYCEEKLSNYQQAIDYRLKVTKLDPWNAKNYLGLAQLYKVIGDKNNMKLSVQKILAFASKDPIADVAVKEFLGNSNN